MDPAKECELHSVPSASSEDLWNVSTWNRIHCAQFLNRRSPSQTEMAWFFTENVSIPGN